MCYAVRCSACGKTTWAGCGLHIEAVKRRVPAGRWCDGHADDSTAGAHKRTPATDPIERQNR
nr:hypothetical protein [Mycobacterium stomatepiae]